MSPSEPAVLSAAEAAGFGHREERIDPQGCVGFFIFSVIFLPFSSLIQCRKLSTDSALLGSRNPTHFLTWRFAVFCFLLV